MWEDREPVVSCRPQLAQLPRLAEGPPHHVERKADSVAEHLACRHQARQQEQRRHRDHPPDEEFHRRPSRRPEGHVAKVVDTHAHLGEEPSASIEESPGHLRHQGDCRGLGPTLHHVTNDPGTPTPGPPEPTRCRRKRGDSRRSCRLSGPLGVPLLPPAACRRWRRRPRFVHVRVVVVVVVVVVTSIPCSPLGRPQGDRLRHSPTSPVEHHGAGEGPMEPVLGCPDRERGPQGATHEAQEAGCPPREARLSLRLRPWRTLGPPPSANRRLRGWTLRA